MVKLEVQAMCVGSRHDVETVIENLGGEERCNFMGLTSKGVVAALLEQWEEGCLWPLLLCETNTDTNVTWLSLISEDQASQHGISVWTQGGELSDGLTTLKISRVIKGASMWVVDTKTGKGGFTNSAVLKQRGFTWA